MAPRPRGNTALIEQENLTKEEQTLMDENQKAQFEPEVPETPEQTPTPTPATPATPESTPTPAPTTPEGTAATPPTPESGTPEKQRTVDYGAFHEERERRKEERTRREKAEAELAKLTGRFSTLEELARAATQQMQPQPKSPDISTDPVGHFQAELAARDARIAQFENWQREQQVMAQQQAQITAIRNRAVAAEAEFSKTTPDYVEAAEFVQMIRNAQLEAVGFADPAQRQQQLAIEALNLAAGAEQRGQNAAAVIYQMAKASGWKPKAAAAASQPTATNGTAQQQPDPAGAKKLETVARGQAANQSIGKLNGQSAPTGAPSLEELSKMSDEEFDAATKGDNWRKLFA
jgi:hypothetical protein